MAFFGLPPVYDIDVDEVHVSVTFSYDKDKGEALAEQWSKIAPVKIGGVAYGDKGGDFISGMYLKEGYTITSRGCPNKCWFCDVWRREGTVRELPIVDGWNLLDSNILACSDNHIKSVFAMMKRQKKKAQLTGGLEAKLLTHHHVSMLWKLRPEQMFFAYDTPDDYEPLVEAGKKLRYADFTRQHLRCYVLIGYPDDTIDKAKKRLFQTWEAGFMPMAMLYKNKEGSTNLKWTRFQRIWARPALTRLYIKDQYIRGHR